MFPLLGRRSWMEYSNTCERITLSLPFNPLKLIEISLIMIHELIKIVVIRQCKVSSMIFIIRNFFFCSLHTCPIDRKAPISMHSENIHSILKMPQFRKTSEAFINTYSTFFLVFRMKLHSRDVRKVEKFLDFPSSQQFKVRLSLFSEK